MYLENIIEKLNELTIATTVQPISKLYGLDKEAIQAILNAAAETQALEQTLLRLTDRVRASGASYLDLINYVENRIRSGCELFTQDDIAALESYTPHIPFIINSLATQVFAAALSYVNPHDIFFPYYRISNGIFVAANKFSRQSPHWDAVRKALEVSHGLAEAPNTQMPEHNALPFIVPFESSQIAAAAAIAPSMAIGLSNMYKPPDSVYQDNTGVHLFLGDGGLNEPTFDVGMKLMLWHLARQATHLLMEKRGMSYEDVIVEYYPIQDLPTTLHDPKRDLNDLQDLSKLYENCFSILKEGNMRYAIHILDNSRAITASRQVSYPMGHPLFPYIPLLEKLGFAIHTYNPFNLSEVIGVAQEVSNAKGIVVTYGYPYPRPGGHSAAAPFGLHTVSDQDRAPLSTQNLALTQFDNNYDVLLESLKQAAEAGLITRAEAIKLVQEAHDAVIRTFIDLIPEINSHFGQANSPANIMKWQDSDPQAYWDYLVERGSANRREYWPSHLNFLRQKPSTSIGGFPEAQFPEELPLITPLQATNFSLAELMILLTENNQPGLIAMGQDIPDGNPFKIEEYARDTRLGAGGIKRQTWGLQVLAHTINPQTGRFHVTDIGINEEGLYSLAAGIKHAVGEHKIVFLEIQFHDYDLSTFGIEALQGIYEMTNGLINTPVIVWQRYGFIVGGNLDDEYKTGGAGGRYHSACNIGAYLEKYPGFVIVMPNTAEATVNAYRMAAASQTPTIILESNPVMSQMRMEYTFAGDAAKTKSGFKYSGKYKPVEEKLDPLGTYYEYLLGCNKISDVNQVIITYGEYVPIAYLVAERLLEYGIKTYIIDVNYINPFDRQMLSDMLVHFPDKKPKITVLSQENEHGFGKTLYNLVLEQEDIDDVEFLYKATRSGQWMREKAIWPTPDDIYVHILNQHFELDAIVDPQDPFLSIWYADKLMDFDTGLSPKELTHRLAMLKPYLRAFPLA